MIVISRKNFPAQKLAFTEAGEYAYFIPPGEAPSHLSTPLISPSRMQWYPNIEDLGRLTAFIPGNPGAGKSYLTNELLNLLPSNAEILLLTSLEEDDGNFDELRRSGRLYKIKMTKDNLENLTLTNIRRMCKNPVLVFDDVDKIRDKDISKLVFALMEDALANGRGHKNHDGVGDIHVICTSHSLNDYKKTKYTLENCDFIAVFPQSTTYSQMRKLYEKIGLTKEMCDNAIALGKQKGIRYILIHKVTPMFSLSGPLIELI